MNYILSHIDIFDLLVLMVSVPIVLGLFGSWAAHRKMKENL